jgi:hypothetical protein
MNLKYYYGRVLEVGPKHKILGRTINEYFVRIEGLFDVCNVPSSVVGSPVKGDKVRLTLYTNLYTSYLETIEKYNY